MKFADFISVKAIKPELESKDKEAVIRELVASLVAAGEIMEDSADSIIKAIMKREELGSTGIGRGIAVPHTKHPSVEKLVGTVGVSVEGVDFNSLDGESVHLFFLLVSPPDRPGDHLRALENISRQLRDDMFCKFLKQSKTIDDIKQLLDEADNNQFGS
ncbi:PTS sugar transporter subunit IIA [Bremerella cremea]|uniref:PTS sugar transporter subunit IIA n=1 Tax=Bremerella cremea TaxID=1031537 RepID=A0A368KIW4_9BACT|nr:PTS sugar transporter subunit IIA [Bremerella cremea]RCS40503.1 PTS sugar transporter subunit IIA [Bremerella cremea]